MIKILICDDRQEWLDEIKNQLKKCMDIPYSVFAFDNAKTLLDYLSSNSADIIITDIQMPQMNGIELANTVFKACSHETQIIFTSVFKDYIQEIFESHPAAFILKPFEDDKFSKAIEIALENLDSQKESIAVPSKNNTTYIRYNTISFVESFRRTVIFHTDDGEHTCSAKLDEIEEKLPHYFIRCHQSYLVNCKRIKGFSKSEIELMDSSIIPIAKARSAEVKKEINKFFAENI